MISPWAAMRSVKNAHGGQSQTMRTEKADPQVGFFYVA